MAEEKGTTKEKCPAEREGMSFEERCEAALEHIMEAWEVLGELTALRLRFRQRLAQEKEEALAKMGEEDRIFVQRVLEKLERTGPERDEDYFRRGWDARIEAVSEVYGSDAVDFARKAFEATRMAN